MAYSGGCVFAPSRPISIRLDQMFLHLLIQLIDKDEKFTGIAT